MHCDLICGVGIRRIGQGPALVLVPGLAGLATFWDATARALADRHQLIAIDHPGMGGSLPVDTHAIPAIVASVCDVLDALGIERCTLVGHSTGGLVAQALALDHPARLAGLVLSSTWARPDQRFEDLFRLRQQVLDQAGLPAYTRLGQILGYPPAWYAEHRSPDPAAGLQADAPSAARTIAQRIEMLLSYQRADELHRIQTPTLVVGALDDNIVPFLHAQELARRIPLAQLAELSGGHFTPTTRTADYAQRIARFTGDLS